MEPIQSSPPVCLMASFAMLLMPIADAAEEGAASMVYRCPGPPVVYTDKITADEARARNCRSIEGTPIQIRDPVQPAPTQPSRWALAGTGTKTTVYVDTQSLRKAGTVARVWLKWTSTVAMETTRAQPAKTYLSEKTFAIYDCSNRTSATLQVIRYADSDAAGDVVESFSIREPQANFDSVAPESLGEAILKVVCETVSRAN